MMMNGVASLKDNPRAIESYWRTYHTPWANKCEEYASFTQAKVGASWD